MELARCILDSCAASTDFPCIECDGDLVSRSEFAARVLSRRDELVRAGVRAGDRVGVVGGRGDRYWSDLVAVWHAGGSVVPIDAASDVARREQLLTHASARFVLESDLHDVAPQHPENFGIADECAVLFTSGSTGLPSAVALTAGALLGNAYATGSVLDMRNDTRLAIAIPFHFTSAICHFLSAILHGGTLVCTEQKQLAGDLLGFLRSGRASAFGGSPLQVRWLADSPIERMPPLEWVMSSGDRLPPDVTERLLVTRPAIRLFITYGLTEVAGRLCILDPDMVRDVPSSVGRPIPGMRVTVRDEDGREVPRGESGEVYADGAYLARRYIRDSRKTAERFSTLGFKTGDTGYMDDRDRLTLTGRLDDVFKSAGQKIDSIAIQDALIQSGLVFDVAVLGVPDPLLGMVPHAYIVPREPALAPAEILSAVREKLPPNHIPRRIITVGAIPRTGSGKVDRRALRALQDAN